MLHTYKMDNVVDLWCGDLSIRLGIRIGPHRHQLVVEVHWRGAQG